MCTHYMEFGVVAHKLHTLLTAAEWCKCEQRKTTKYFGKTGEQKPTYIRRRQFHRWETVHWLLHLHCDPNHDPAITRDSNDPNHDPANTQDSNDPNHDPAITQDSITVNSNSNISYNKRHLATMALCRHPSLKQPSSSEWSVLSTTSTQCEYLNT